MAAQRVGMLQQQQQKQEQQQQQQPVIERRILFHPARRSDSARQRLPPGIEPLNPAPEADIEAAKASCKRSWHEMAGCSSDRAQHDDIDIVLDWGAPSKIGAGLSNLGNTCFLNSVLQCLTYTPPLSNFLGSGKHQATCRNAGFCALCALEGHVKVALKSWGKVVSPNNLVKNLRSISRAFQHSRQEDAHEYLRYLLEALHKASLPKSSCSNKSDKSLMHKIFGGQLRSQVKCTVCNHCSDTFDPFLDLSLEITQAESLGKALARFTGVEVLDGDNKYQCSKCQKKVRALKRFTIDTAPNILTVQFKRFSSYGHHGRKIDKKVHFGRTLDLKPFMSNPKNPAIYELYGVLVHSGGSTHSGHYFCFVRTAADMWHVLDDSRVNQLSEKAVLDQKAYILFYMRKPDKPAGPAPSAGIAPAIRPALPQLSVVAAAASKSADKTAVEDTELQIGSKPSDVAKVHIAKTDNAGKAKTDSASKVKADNAGKASNSGDEATKDSAENLKVPTTTDTSLVPSQQVQTTTKEQPQKQPQDQPQKQPLDQPQVQPQDQPQEQQQQKTLLSASDIDTAPVGATAELQSSASDRQPSKDRNEMEITPEPSDSSKHPDGTFEQTPEIVKATECAPKVEVSERRSPDYEEAPSPGSNKRRRMQEHGAAIVTSSKNTSSPKKVDKSYLKLLRNMPKSRRFLLAMALENAQANVQGECCKRPSEKTNGSVKMNGVRPSPETRFATEDASVTPTKVAPMSTGSTAAPTQAAAVNTALGTSSSSTSELFGDSVARWDGAQANGIGNFLKAQHRIPNGRRDEWDEEYDRGKVKKVRRGAAGGRLSADENPFQILASAKQKK